MVLIEELAKRTIVIVTEIGDRIVAGPLLGQRVRMRCVTATRMTVGAGTFGAVAMVVQAKDRGVMQRRPEV